MSKIAIIMPAYNEEKRIGKTLEAYSSYFNYLLNKKIDDYEINVIINNTTDRTEDVVRKLIEKNKKVRFLNFKEGGKGFAVIEGFKDCLSRENDIIGFVDADMATSPEEYWKLLENLGKNDGVIANRYMEGSRITPPVTFQRLFAKKLFNFFVRGILFLPYSDTQCGAKVFRREVIENIIGSMTMSQWAFDVELLYVAKKRGFHIKSFPTHWIDKEYAKINFWKAGPWMALGVLRLRILNSPFKRLLKVYDKYITSVPKT